jgi:hypothetical protein
MRQTKPPRKVPGGIAGLIPDLDRPHGFGRGDPPIDAKFEVMPEGMLLPALTVRD